MPDSRPEQDTTDAWHRPAQEDVNSTRRQNTTTELGRMATVRQSITALYEESQKSALEGMPMLAVLHSHAMEPDTPTIAMPDAEPEPEAPAAGIAARFDELRRLADIEAKRDRARTPFKTSHHGLTRGAGDAPAKKVPVKQVPAEQVPVEQVPAETILAEDRLADIDLAAESETSVPAHEPVTPDAEPATETKTASDASRPADVPIIEIPSAAIEAAFDGKPAAESALPDEPPAPAAGEPLGDLDIADIQSLVRQAWEDETALGDVALTAGTADTGDAATPAPPTPAPSTPAPPTSAETHPDAPDTALSGNIEMAMEEIAAAVVQSADATVSLDVDAMKAEIIGAMRTELQAVVQSDLRSIVKAAVAEAMSELPITSATPKTAAASKTTAKKPAAKKAAAAKAGIKKTAVKKAAAKRTAKQVSARPTTGDETDDS